MKWKRDWMNTRWASYTAAACCAIVFYLILSHLNVIGAGFGKLYNFFRPVFLGIVIAYIINPIVRVFEEYVFRGVKRSGIRHVVSTTVTLIAIILCLVLLNIKLIPQLAESVMTFIGNINNYVSSLQSWLDGLSSTLQKHDVDISRFLNFSDDILSSLQTFLPNSVDSAISMFSSIGSNVFDVVIAIIMAIYFLMDKDRMIRGLGHLRQLIFTQNYYEKSNVFWKRCNNILIRYIFFDLLDGLIIGVANFIFMLIAGMPYGVLISVVVGVTNLAPTFGPILGAVIGGFILLLVNPWYLLYFLIFTLILQTMDGYVLKPKLFGGTFGVPSVWILICIIVGGRMFSVAGILLAIPFAAISDFIYHDYILTKLKKRKEKRKLPAVQTAEPSAGEERKSPETDNEETT